jgi:hypothetical protein
VTLGVEDGARGLSATLMSRREDAGFRHPATCQHDRRGRRPSEDRLLIIGLLISKFSFSQNGSASSHNRPTVSSGAHVDMNLTKCQALRGNFEKTLGNDFEKGCGVAKREPVVWPVFFS